MSDDKQMVKVNDHAHHNDTTTFMGKTYNVPVYTAVFFALGLFTIFEVLIAELLTGGIKAVLLLGLAVVKSVLVMLFYMHLKDDNPWFRWTVLLPFFVAVLSLLFLLAVPNTGY